MTDSNTINPCADPISEAIVMSFIEMIQEHKARGYMELEATWQIIARWISNRSGLNVQPRHIGILTEAMSQASIITVGGGGVGTANTYDITEKSMGTKQFWAQVEAFLAVWHHPSSKSMATESDGMMVV